MRDDGTKSLLTEATYGEIFRQKISTGCELTPYAEHTISSPLIKVVTDFIQSENCDQVFNKYDDCLESLQQVSDILLGQNDSVSIKWFSKYRCALVAQKSQGCSPSPVRNLTLVGLDKWQMHMHQDVDNSSVSINQASVAGGFAIQCMQPVREEDFDRFLENVKHGFSEIYHNSQKSGKNRHNSKTPAHVELVLRNSFEKLSSKDQDKKHKNEDDDREDHLGGGWSSVRNPIGGDWSLLIAVMEHLLNHTVGQFSSSLYQLFICQFEFALANNQAQLLLPQICEVSTTAGKVDRYVNKLMTMISSVAQKAASLTELYDMEEVGNGIDEIRKKLDLYVSNRLECVADKYQLQSNCENINNARNPIIDVALAPIVGEVGCNDKTRTVAQSNVDLFPLFKGNDQNIWEVELFLESLDKHPNGETNLTVVYLATGAVEDCVFSLVSKLDDDLEVGFDMEVMQRVVDSYRQWNRCLISLLGEEDKGGRKSVLKVGLMSKETLVLWATFCLMHNHMKSKIPLIREYGLALKWDDIKHFVFSKKTALAASLCVSSYIKQNTINDKPLFSLSEQSSTLEFGMRYALSSSVFQELWKNEKLAAQSRVDDHWKKVLAKQKEVRRLEGEILHFEAEREKLRLKMKTLSYENIDDRDEIDETSREIDHCDSMVNRTRRSLKMARIPPDPVYQPLPAEEENAMRILFFLHMPEDLQIFSRMCIAARQMLLPSLNLACYTALEKKEIKKINKNVEFTKQGIDILHNWATYYNGHTPTKQSSIKILHPFSEFRPPQSSEVGFSDVMSFYDRGQGVWYPDDLRPMLFWRGGGCSLDTRGTCFFNPFAHKSTTEVVEYFTEKADRQIQFTFIQYGKDTSLDRGNRPIAKQAKKPKWLRKPEWLAFASLRAFPNQQLRRLCSAICDRSVPLDNPAVHNLIRHTLYHTGDVTSMNDSTINPAWKFDLLKGEFCSIMLNELLKLAEELLEKPSSHASILVLIETANYVSQWSAECVGVARQCVEIIKGWVSDTDDQIRDADPNDIPTLRAKKGVFYHYLLLCYSKGNLHRDDASELCKLLVHAQNESRFHELTPYDEQLRVLVNMRGKMMTERIHVLYGEALKDGFQMLSEAVKVILYETPPDLHWRNMKFYHDTSSCFEAEDREKNLYNINLLNGTVLYNGKPLSSLPLTVLQHPLFKRSFEDRDFETCVSGNIVKTVMPVKGCLYSFAIQSEELFVLEKDVNTGVELRLLDSLALLTKQSWGSEIPLILKERYSHWFCADHKVITLRPRYFCQREVEFILKQNNDGDWKCFRIPIHLKSGIWDMYLKGSVKLEDFDQLVLYKSSTMDILSKFESTTFIHTYISSDHHLKFHFPRYDLEFTTSLDKSEHFKSRDYAGYSLSLRQQLSDTLPHFKRYLVLEHDKHRSDDMRIIVPQGSILKLEDGETSVDTGEDSGSVLSVHTYNIHSRLKSLQASSISARIHLAVLYASTASLLPDARFGMTGEEAALSLIRCCWTNRPLSENDYQKLHELSKLCCNVPALSLLCYEVACSSVQTKFLYPREEQTNKMKFPSDFAGQYMQETYPWNVRSSLTSLEELRILGHTRRPRSNYMSRIMHVSDENVNSEPDEGIAADPANEAEKSVATYEQLLTSVLQETERAKENFPLMFGSGDVGKNEETDSDVDSEDGSEEYCESSDSPEQEWINKNGIGDGLTYTDTKLYSFMMSGLKRSHEAYHQLHETKVGNGMVELFRFISQEITKQQVNLRAVLFKDLMDIPSSYGRAAQAFHILQSANCVPSVSLEDLLKSALTKDWIQSLNPFISTNVMHTIWQRILVWLKLCTLEDKMKRLLKLCEGGVDGSNVAVKLLVMQELAVHRTWSVEEHPHWLVFEVFAQLQIRPIQYTVAKSMIEGIEKENCNPITQLNMGEGKTRVILPMLVLHWQAKNKLVRLNFLSPLLQEAADYLHNMLCGSVLGVKIFLFPFSRDVALTPERAQTLFSALEYCDQVHGVVLVAPEHRLSLKLKRIELRVKGANKVCEKLDQFDTFNFLDVLDEVDEILKTKNKLVYALGNQEQLPSKECRWNVLEALLGVLATSEPVKTILANPLVSQGHIMQEDGRFQEVRLLAGDAFNDVKVIFVETLLRELINSPPFELRWMKELKASLHTVINYLTDPTEATLELPNFDSSQINDIFALRGFLTNDIFVHCLMKRNRVHYGVNRSSGRKLMAVPFHACETPSLRAEFGHPDCALMYTCLAYYYDGLEEAQVCEAFATLQLLGTNAQSVIYNSWYELSKPSMDAAHWMTLDVIQKIDMSNTILVSMLVKYFCYNRLVINFWLNSCVFPLETMQFPHRLEATAWDLATNCQNQVAGFSGTNDDRIIMPTTLSWVEPDDLALIGTDGKMLHLLRKSEFQQLAASQPGSNIVQNDLEGSEAAEQWINVLDFVIGKAEEDSTHCTCALIDAGALMAGAPNNQEVAAYLAQRLDKGVIYFDIDRSGWWARDKFGRSWPKHSSPIHERDGFVYFDESRTRGADMKLNSNACAVLTLAIDMCKDKLMQAAGRMRMLEHGQQLLIVGTRDVSSKIRYHNNIKSGTKITLDHVLNWVMANSVKNIAKWLPEWALQGGQYVTKCDNPKLALIPDIVSLEDMYGCSLEEQPVPLVWKNKKKAFLEKNKHLTESSRETFSAIDDRVKEFGAEFMTKSSGNNMEEECERELEKEVELEQILERQVAVQESRQEEDWLINMLLESPHPLALSKMQSFLNPKPPPTVKRLSEFIENDVFYEGEPTGKKLVHVDWPQNIFATANFFYTCASDENTRFSANDYLRTIDAYLVFADGSVLLISERECDRILELVWLMQKCQTFALVQWTYARQKDECGVVGFQCPSLASDGSFMVSEEVLVALDLFQGVTMFHSDRKKKIAEQMLTSYSAKQLAPLFCVMRGVGFTYSRSDLELICTTYYRDEDEVSGKDGCTECIRTVKRVGS